MTAIISAILALLAYNFILKNSESKREKKLETKSEEKDEEEPKSETKSEEEKDSEPEKKESKSEKEEVFVDISNCSYSENSEDSENNDYDYMTI